MNQKQIGIIVLVIGIIMMGFSFFIHERNKAIADYVLNSTGACILADGTCLHETANTLPVIGWIISGGLLLLGLYLVFFDKTQQKLAAHQVQVTQALENASKHEKERDEFTAFLSGFTADEQDVIKAIKEQDGIQQATLRYRLGMSKASLSMLLQSLEKRGIISREEEGKTNLVYLRKKF